MRGIEVRLLTTFTILATVACYADPEMRSVCSDQIIFPSRNDREHLSVIRKASSSLYRTMVVTGTRVFSAGRVCKSLRHLRAKKLAIASPKMRDVYGQFSLMSTLLELMSSEMTQLTGSRKLKQVEELLYEILAFLPSINFGFWNLHQNLVDRSSMQLNRCLYAVAEHAKKLSFKLQRKGRHQCNVVDVQQSCETNLASCGCRILIVHQRDSLATTTYQNASFAPTAYQRRS